MNKLSSSRPPGRPTRLPGPAPRRVRAAVYSWLPALCAGLALATTAPAQAEPRLATPTPLAGLPDALAADVTRLVQSAAAVVWGDTGQPPRIEVQVGRPDARLRLAACAQIVPYLPAGTRPLGRTRIGLRCVQGPSAWNISLPVTVKVWAPAVVAATTLPVGTVLGPQHLARAEVDLAERSDPALLLPAAALGRTLARGQAPGDALRRDDLKLRQWFNAGDTVRILAVGPGFAVGSEGQALGPGLDGQVARVRTEGGRIVSGIAAGAHRVELPL